MFGVCVWFVVVVMKKKNLFQKVTHLGVILISG